MDAAARKEYSIAEREQRIYKLEQRWKFVHEDEQVRSGFREPENGTALEKAQRAYGSTSPRTTTRADRKSTQIPISKTECD